MRYKKKPVSNIADVVDFLIKKDLKLVIEPVLCKEYLAISFVNDKGYIFYTTIDLLKYKGGKNDARNNIISAAIDQLTYMIDQGGLKNE